MQSSVVSRAPFIRGDYRNFVIVVNMITRVVNAEPGLKTEKDLRVPHATPRLMRKDME